MFSAGETRGGGNIRSDVSADATINNWVKLVESGAPAEEIARAEEAVAKALNVKPFELREKVPFFQRFAKALAGSQGYQSFRLPGRDVVVKDLRDKMVNDTKEGISHSQDEVKQTGKEIIESRIVRDGKLVRDAREAKEANRVEKAFERGGLDRNAATENFRKLLTSFERMIIKRFEEGKTIEQNFKGDPVFAAKSKEQWGEFFKAFLGRTIKKSTSLEDIKNFLFRGLVSKSGKGMFIGDMNLGNGRTEKFIRFLIMGDLLSKLNNLKPGQTLSKTDLAGMSGEELMYLSLSPSERRQYGLSDKATDGMFGDGRAEAMAAENLGLPIEQQLRAKARALKKKRGAGFGSLFEKDPAAEDIPYQFVPWWHWGNLAKPSPTKWVTRVFYTALLVISLLGIAVMTYKLMGNG